MKDKSLCVAVVNWTTPDENADAISAELMKLNYRPISFLADQPIPPNADVVFTFGPYGRFHQIARRFADFGTGYDRPSLVHWNFESMPNFSLPWVVTRCASVLRAWVDQLNDSERKEVQKLNRIPALALLHRRTHKLRYVGSYFHAYRQGWLDLLCDASQINARRFSAHGLPTLYAPWGISSDWYADLNLERDIDVLWFGKWRTRRRGILLREIRDELARRGLTMYMADNVEKPYIYGDERTNLLNRAKITLNILPTWYDPGFVFRFSKAAANKSLVITDPPLPHIPDLEAETHYVSTSLEFLLDTILYYLKEGDARQKIVENAYDFVAQQLMITDSIRKIMRKVSTLR